MLRKALISPALVLLISASSYAGFTPPTDPTPYLPPANVVTNVIFVTQIGPIGVYTSNLNWSIAVRNKGLSQNQLAVLLARAASWQKFRLGTITSDSLNDPVVVNTAQQWWLDHIGPAFVVPAVKTIGIRK